MFFIVVVVLATQVLPAADYSRTGGCTCPPFAENSVVKKARRNYEAVAAAYALRTPAKQDRFTDGWAFVRAVYGPEFGRAEARLSPVFEYDRTQDTAGQDAAVRRAAEILLPGDVVVSDGTNVCFYAGDVYGDGRSKVLAINPAGFVSEWDAGNYLFNWPHNLQKLHAAERFEVFRPINDPTVKIVDRRNFPRGIGEKIADERVRAVLATAWAHYVKNECTQYDSIGLVCHEILRATKKNWSRKNDKLPIEACTRDRTYYSVCSSFAYEVYYGAFGYGIGDDHKGRLSFELTQFPPPDILVYRHEKGKDAKSDKTVIAEARAALKPGDVIAYSHQKKTKAGHVLIYVGQVDGIPTLLHSSGQKFDFNNKFDKVEMEGTIYKNDLDDCLFTKGNPRYILKFDEFVILRPLKKAELALTITGKARAAHPKFRYDRCVAGGIYGSVLPGEHLRYTVEVFNAANEPSDATIYEKLPKGVEFVSCSLGGVCKDNVIECPIMLKPEERRTFEWTVRVLAEPGEEIVAEGGSAGGIPSNRLVTQVVARRVSVDDAFRWADRNLMHSEEFPSCRVRDWCGGYRTAEPPRDERVRETRSRDLMPGDVVAIWEEGQPKPIHIWVRDAVGLVERTDKGLSRVDEARVTALLAADRFVAFRPAAEP
jgi:hypothetical protein